MLIDRLDHPVLTVADIERACAFYPAVLGFDVVGVAGGRTALSFGRQKLNLHQAGHAFEPKALKPTPGSGDLCFITTTPIDTVVAHLRSPSVPIEAGPVARTGALGPILSVYIRDPDRNLSEIAANRPE